MAEEEELLASKSNDSEEEREDDEEEALSLCDLPLNEEISKCCKETLEATQMRENEEEFNFGSKESEMCAADEVFFKGQILPLRLSVSSESGLSRFQQESRNTSRCLSRSESMDHGFSSAGSTSINSSRSSSTRSYYSSTTTTTTTTTTSLNSTQKIRNNFHSCPSPNPQIRVSSFRLSNVSNSSSGSRSQKSTIWDLFRIGLVRTPEIELQDLKLRNHNINRSGCVSRNSSSGSSSNNSSCNNNIGSQKDPNLEKKQQTKKQINNIFEKRIGLFNLSSCKCSLNAVETVPLNNTNSHTSFVVIKSGVGSSEELKIKKRKKKKKKRTKEEEEKKQEGKQAMSRHRTFEWLKELSHGSYVVVDDDQDHHHDHQ